MKEVPVTFDEWGANVRRMSLGQLIAEAERMVVTSVPNAIAIPEDRGALGANPSVSASEAPVDDTPPKLAAGASPFPELIEHFDRRRRLRK